MKNTIRYYYNLNVDNIHHIKDKYFFSIKDDNYVFMECNRTIEEIEEIYKISIEFLKKNVYTHQIVLNNEHKIITNVNDKTYILMKIYDRMSQKIKIDDLLYFESISNIVNFTSILKRDNWGILWSNKMDYFEYQVSQFGKKYPLIRESFGYFLGLAETGIQLYNMLNHEEQKLVICHNRINEKSTLFDLYNPLNFIIDIKTRDISEYFKSSFLNNINIYNDIKKYIDNSIYTDYELCMFFVRMLYPSYYFDIYEQIIDFNKDEQLIISVIKNANIYENFLKKFYLYLNNRIELPEIEYLKK